MSVTLSTTLRSWMARCTRCSGRVARHRALMRSESLRSSLATGSSLRRDWVTPCIESEDYCKRKEGICVKGGCLVREASWEM